MSVNFTHKPLNGILILSFLLIARKKYYLYLGCFIANRCFRFMNLVKYTYRAGNNNNYCFLLSVMVNEKKWQYHSAFAIPADSKESTSNSLSKAEAVHGYNSCSMCSV